MVTFLVLAGGAAVITAVCKLVFALVALRGVPSKRRAEVVLAIGEAWRWWRR